MHESVTIEDVRKAYQVLRGVVHQTALDRSSTFSNMVGNDVFLKLENLQKTGSFKIRGAYYKIASLSAAERARGVIAASAGNHAQGVAYAASLAGVKSTIVMPEAAPLAKVVATRGYGAEVVLSGDGYDEAYQKAKELEAERGQTFIHAFNDRDVMAGQGTLGIEILQELPDVAAVVVPIGGGGLLAGVALAIKELAPHVKVYGVQAAGAPAMYMSKLAHAIRTTPEAATMADGIAVKQPGDKTFAVIDRYVDDIFVVDDEAIAGAILMLLERAKLMVEGAGAVSLAAVLQHKIPVTGKIVSLLSGGNIDVNFIARIIERGLVKAGRRVRISTLIKDSPGSLQQLLTAVARTRANVINVYHDRVERQVPIGQAVVELSLETRDGQHTEQILHELRQQGYQAQII